MQVQQCAFGGDRCRVEHGGHVFCAVEQHGERCQPVDAELQTLDTFVLVEQEAQGAMAMQTLVLKAFVQGRPALDEGTSGGE